MSTFAAYDIRRHHTARAARRPVHLFCACTHGGTGALRRARTGAVRAQNHPCGRGGPSARQGTRGHSRARHPARARHRTRGHRHAVQAVAMDGRLLHGAHRRRAQGRAAGRAQGRGGLQAAHGALRKAAPRVWQRPWAARGARHDWPGRQAAGGIRDIPLAVGMGRGGRQRQWRDGGGSDARRASKRQPHHHGHRQRPGEARAARYLHTRGGPAEHRGRARLHPHEAAGRGAAAGLQRDNVFFPQEKRGVAPRGDVERKDRDIHSPHQAGHREPQAGALPAARDCTDGADNRAAAPRVRRETGHIPLAIL